MSEVTLPNSWANPPISDCCDLNPKLDKSQFADGQLVHFVPMPAVEALTNKVDVSATRTFAEVKKGYTPFVSGDVLFAKITPCMENGKMVVVPELPHGLAFGSTEFHVIRPRGGLDPLWFFYFVSSRPYRSNAEHNMTGAVGQRRVPIDFIARSLIPLPPLAEQKRIVAKIEELFSELEAGEESLRVARRQLGVYRQSLLKQAFEGKLTARWRTQNPAKFESPAQLLARIQSARQARYEEQLKKWASREESDNRPKQAKPRSPLPPSPLDEEVLARLPALPHGWTWAKMEDTCDVVRGGSPRPAGDPMYYDGDIPFLKVADLTRVEGPYVDNYTSTIKPAGLQKTRYVEPPVLLISNSGATLGVPRICRIAATFNDGVAAFLDLDPESHRFFYYFWTSKTEALRNIDQGAAQPNLNTDLLKTYPVPVCSLPEQQEIVRLLDEQFEVIERNEREIDGALRKSEALRQAILQKAFTGRLVPQSPADEPASTLLARLRAERQKAKS